MLGSLLMARDATDANITSYSGDEPYLFICYSHRDQVAVADELARLSAQGIRFWYDDGIRPGSSWTDELAKAIAGCEKLVFFATPQSASSSHCRDEIQYALNHAIPIITVYLEETVLPPGLDLMLGARQAILRFASSEPVYEARLLDALRAGPQDDFVPKSGPPVARTVSSAELRAVASPRRWSWLLLPVLIGLSWLGWSLFSSQPDETAPRLSVAVLPLENRGGFDDDAYFPDSISEDLLNRLVVLDGLAVASRRESFGYRESDQQPLELREVAAALSVRYLVAGHIRKDAKGLHLSIELIDASTDRTRVLWSNRFAAVPTQQLLAVQGKVIQSVADVFFPEGLKASVKERLSLSSTQNSTAFEYYLEAQQILRAPLNQGALDRAELLLRQALELDPDFAWAQAGLCTTYLALFQYSGDFTHVRVHCELLASERNTDVFAVQLALGDYLLETAEPDRALPVLKHAIELNGRSSDAKTALGMAYAARYRQSQAPLDLLRAREAYLEAIDTEPGFWRAYHAYGIFLVSRGELDAATAFLQQAIERNPTNTPSITTLGNVYYRLGRTADAAEQWRQTLELKPDDRWANAGLGIMKHYARAYPEAIGYLRRAIDAAPLEHSLWGRLGESYRMLDDGEADALTAFQRALDLLQEQRKFDSADWQLAGYQALYLAYLGDAAAADSALQEMFALNPGREPMTHYWAALVAYEAGDAERAFAELELSLKDGFGEQKRFIADEPALQSLRERFPDRYQELLDGY